MEVDTFEIELQPGDRFLLCSDGLTGYLDGDELCEVMQEPDNDTLVHRLIAIANERGGRDNITAVMVELPADALPGVVAPADETEAELRRSVLGSGLNSSDARALRQRLKVGEYVAGARIFDAGTRGREVYLVVEGSLRLTAEGLAPRRVETGEIVGEDHLLTGGYHFASLEVTADGPAKVASLDRSGYRSLARDQPLIFARVSLNLARQLSSRLTAAATALSDPLWRYRGPTQPNTVTIRRRPTVDLQVSEVEEVDAGPPPLLPDTDEAFDVGVMDTSPGIDLREVKASDAPSDELT